MFRRRQAPGIGYHVRNFFWPSMGWRRAFAYMGHRLARLKASRYAIACGFACGAAVSFTPFVGMHFILGGISAWIMRGNILASAIGTAVGNPWTFPFIWVWIYQLGHWMGVGHNPEGPTIPFATLFGEMVKAGLRLDFTYLEQSAWPIFGPMLVGSIPTTIVAWLVFYYLIHMILGGHHRAREERRRRRREAAGRGEPPTPHTGAGESPA